MTAEQLWEKYLDTLPEDHPTRSLLMPVAGGYGDSPHLADDLGKLIYEGSKTATCASLWEFESQGLLLPEVGTLEIVLDGRGLALAIVELTEVTTRPFDDVDADFAFEEGEGDRSLANWRDGHWRYFVRVLAKIGREPDPKMPLICQRFKLLFRS